MAGDKTEMNNLPLEIDCRSTKLVLDARDGALLLDCRENDEYATSKIAAAKLLPMSEITDRLGELEPHRACRIIVHCHHGGRSLRVARWLREQGFSQAQSMAGGIDAWSQEVDRAVPRY
jgi:rhodanese-related sulfurtransferase